MKKVVIGIIIAVIVIAIGAGAYFMLNSEKEENTDNANQNVLSANNERNVVRENNSEEIDNDELNENDVASIGKTLVTYFSLPETRGDAKEDSTIRVDGEDLGNTQYVANLIKEHTGADIFRIEAVKQYNISDHQALIADAQEEQRNDARPEIKDTIKNFEDYDTIFIGYPIWWSDLPQILYTFLESYDFTGKNVYLFSTNGGSGLAGTVSTITSKLDSANVNSNAFKLHRNNMEDAPEEVETWLNELGIITNFINN